ncbi:NAD(P)-binding protein [Biscogniauxia marginata]|nr:NAD(P)-binding protein [Biscogniauxia marginata]
MNLTDTYAYIMAHTIVLISGTNRGLGKALLKLYLAKSNHIVIGANRDPSHPTSQALASLPTGTGSRLIIVKVDATVESDPVKAVQDLASQSIDHLDLVIANAGITQAVPKVSDVKTAELQSHFTVNVLGLIWLYQATLPLLVKSTNPKWVSIGSVAGSIENQIPWPNAAYAPTKAAVHWLTRRINEEEPKLNAFIVHPGWIATDMGNFSAQQWGLEKAPESVEDSSKGVVKLVDVATKQTHGGKFWSYKDNLLPW